MKVKTNTGEVELTAEMVCRGMVFRASRHHGPYTLIRRRDGDMWEGNDGTSEPVQYLLDATRRTFLGCDPAYASRADCERFGILEHIDAAAHGFARLRDGGAMDLQREIPRGTVIVRRNGSNCSERVWYGEHVPYLHETEHFIGLDARHARPEDVERLCCGAQPSYEDLAPCDGCTLAIGPHDEHEDIATGVRWRSAPADQKLHDMTVRRPPCGCNPLGRGDGTLHMKGCAVSATVLREVDIALREPPSETRKLFEEQVATVTEPLNVRR